MNLQQNYSACQFTLIAALSVMGENPFSLFLLALKIAAQGKGKPLIFFCKNM